MKKIFRAQSTLEFIMILILVIAGIFVMGPYVIRSVNAYMRSWEISANQARYNPNKPLSATALAVCGNGVCEYGETASSCTSDCWCGNFSCDPGEDHQSCPHDCPSSPCSSRHFHDCCDDGATQCWNVYTQVSSGTLPWKGCFSQGSSDPALSQCQQGVCSICVVSP